MRIRGERGATTAEYGLIAGLAALTLVFGVDALRLALSLLYAGMQGDVDSWVP
jgi:Flp pilus assembly pilin Flp